MSGLVEAGRIVLSIPLALGIVAFVAFQWNTTHVFNPKWHPHARFHAVHARFHAVQLGLFFIALSGIGLWQAWGGTSALPAAAWLAAAVPLIFWAANSPPCWSPAPIPAPTPPTPTPSPCSGCACTATCSSPPS